MTCCVGGGVAARPAAGMGAEEEGQNKAASRRKNDPSAHSYNNLCYLPTVREDIGRVVGASLASLLLAVVLSQKLLEKQPVCPNSSIAVGVRE